MGTVYRPVRVNDSQKQVAVKLVKRGMDTRAQFAEDIRGWVRRSAIGLRARGLGPHVICPPANGLAQRTKAPRFGVVVGHFRRAKYGNFSRAPKAASEHGTCGHAPRLTAAVNTGKPYFVAWFEETHCGRADSCGVHPLNKLAAENSLWKAMECFAFLQREVAPPVQIAGRGQQRENCAQNT
jgi:hypothetical protein